MEVENLSVVDVCYSFSGDIGRAWEAVDLFAKQVGEGYYGIVLFGFGELGNEIYSDLLPWPMGNI